MQKLSREAHSFGEFTLDLARGCLMRGQEEIKLRPKSFEVLKYLVENHGRLISKDELISAVWADTAVTDDSLVQCLKDIRRALGGSAQRIIKTVPRRGYIFDEQVRGSGPTAPVTAYAEETAAVQAITEDEELNGRALIEAPGRPSSPSEGLSARVASRTERVTTAIKQHSWYSLLGALTLAVAVAAIIYFTRPGEAIDSVAVLPFVNLSNDADAEYLSDGISDSIINRLSQLPNLKRVISLSSVLRYKGKEIDPQAVGRELNVRAVLIGKLTQRGDDLLISVELVDLKDNKRIWGEQYNRKLADVLRLQREIAQEISERLRLKLTGEQKLRLAKNYTDNPEANQLYMMGRFYRRNRTGYRQAIDYLEQAIEKDPNYAPAYAQLAYTYGSIGWSGGLPAREVREKQEWAVRRALEIDDALGDPHAVLALMSADMLDWPASIREFQRAVELDPNSADVHSFYAKVLLCLGRIDEAISHMSRAQELDPLSPAIYVDLSTILNSAHQYDQAIERCLKALELNSNYEPAHAHLARCYLAQGRYDEALREAEQGKSSENAQERLSLRGNIYGLMEKKAEAQKMLDGLSELSKRYYVNPKLFAEIYAGLGDKDQAFALLQKQYEDRPTSLSFIKVDPAWESLRSDSRFTDLLRLMNLAQ